jgi:signal transduction histidine kinase
MRHPRILLLALIAATFGLGFLDYVTGPRLSFSLFYLAPVTVASWLLGARSGWVLTAAASLAQLSADFAWGAQEVSLITLWNGFTRISVLGALGHLVAWLRRERDRLDQLLAEQTSAHVATVDQLRHRDRLALVGQIASGLAHELGTPLNVVDGRARLMAEADLSSNERSAHVRSILEQTERMTRIIRQLLDFARRRGPDIGRVDVHDLCGRVLELLRPLASKRAVELTLLPAEGDCAAAVDYNHIQQAISNLVMNAVQAMPDGGEVTVRISAVGGDALILSVSDTGMGIAKDQLGRIFEPFFTTQGAGLGTGLGLSITEGIVKDHGGTIEVTSEVGRGSCFTLRLPRGPVRNTPERT